MLVLWSSIALGADPPPKPEPVAEQDGYPDCPTTIELTPGQPFEPPAWLVDGDGIVRCRAIVEPYTSFADLLTIESSYRELRDLYRIETTMLELSVRHYEQRAAWAEAELARPPGFWERPETAAWRGRLEVIAIMAGTGWVLHQTNQ